MTIDPVSVKVRSSLQVPQLTQTQMPRDVTTATTSNSSLVIPLVTFGCFVVVFLVAVLAYWRVKIATGRNRKSAVQVT